MPGKLDRWRALPGDERRLLVGLAILLPAIDAALRLLGVRRTYRILGGSSRSALVSADAGADGLATALRIGRLVGIAARHGPRSATCLPRSLALWWMLRRRGLPAELRVGVGRGAGGMRAHAWVELAGRAVDDDPALAASYAAFAGLERRLPRSLRDA